MPAVAEPFLDEIQDRDQCAIGVRLHLDAHLLRGRLEADALGVDRLHKEWNQTAGRLRIDHSDTNDHQPHLLDRVAKSTVGRFQAAVNRNCSRVVLRVVPWPPSAPWLRPEFYPAAWHL